MTAALLPSHIGCVYLHGFLSSPASTKAQQLIQYFNDHGMANQLAVPTLAFAPDTAIKQAQDAVVALQHTEGITKVFVIGSSLGGYYATYLSQALGIKALLINPAVAPYALLDKYLGPNQHFYDGQTYVLEMNHIEQLRHLEVDQILRPSDVFLLLQTADETLDYSLACAKYSQCPSWIEAGGNHSFVNFMQRLPMVFHFVCSD